MRKDDGLVLENTNLTHESMIRSEWTTIINEIFPKKYSCFFDLFTDLKELSTILAQLSYMDSVKYRRIENQQEEELNLEKTKKMAILDQMVEQIRQTRNLVSQGRATDINGLSAMLQSCLADFMNTKENHVHVDSQVIDINNSLADYQQRLQETIQKLDANYNSCNNLYTSLMQNVHVGKRQKEHLKYLYLSARKARERHGITNEMPAFEAICSITEAYVECVKAIYSNTLGLVQQTRDSYKKRELTTDSFSKDCRNFNLELMENAYAAIYEDLPRMLTIPENADEIKIFSVSTLLGYRLLEKLLTGKDISNQDLEMYQSLEGTQNLSALHSYRFDLGTLRSLIIKRDYKMTPGTKKV